MKFFIKLIAFALAAMPFMARATDTDNDVNSDNDRAFLEIMPHTQTFIYETPDSNIAVSLRFEPATPLVAQPSEIHFEDLITHTPEIEFFDRLTLKPGSELRVGNKTYPLNCVRVHGSGLASDEDELRSIKLFFPTDDPDGQCIGPLNPNYPATGLERYRWHKYLTVVWNGQENIITSARLTVSGVDYDLTINDN